jgi:amidase
MSMPSREAPPTTAGMPRVLFDFTEPTAVNAWRAIDDRVMAVNPALNAIVDLLPDEALAAADAADAARWPRRGAGPAAWRAGDGEGQRRPAGRATTNGVVAFKDNIATDDSPVVANLRRAGAVIIGRTNTPAFSVRWFTDNDLHGRTLQPVVAPR